MLYTTVVGPFESSFAVEKYIKETGIAKKIRHIIVKHKKEFWIAVR